MTMTERAERELHLAGLFDSDSDYDGAIGRAVMELFKTFSSQGHSGYSAAVVAHLFKELADGKTLTPITDNPNDWVDVSETHGGEPMWQNLRQFGLFSADGGKTYYDVDDRDRTIKKSEPAK